MRNITKFECNHCKEDTGTRIVIERNPLKKSDIVLPDGYEEFYCSNVIKFKRKGRHVNNWVIEECRNCMLVRVKDEI